VEGEDSTSNRMQRIGRRDEGGCGTDGRGRRLNARTKRTLQQEWPLRGKTGRKEDTRGKEGALKGRNVHEQLMSLLYRIILGILWSEKHSDGRSSG